MGPAVGERVAELVLGKRKVDPFFALARFTKTPVGSRPRAAAEVPA
jgi:hypothetical protein